MQFQIINTGNLQITRLQGLLSSLDLWEETETNEYKRPREQYITNLP